MIASTVNYLEVYQLIDVLPPLYGMECKSR